MLRFLLSLIPLSAQAAETAQAGVPGSSYLQAGLALALIVGLLVGTAWLARKLSGGKGFGQGGMKVIGGVALGPRERIVLIEVGSEWLVIGIVPGQIRTLHKLPKGTAPLEDFRVASVEKSFAQWLHGIAERRNHE